MCGEFCMLVLVQIYLDCLGCCFYEEIGEQCCFNVQLLCMLVKCGMCVQLCNGNLFMGQLYVVIDFFFKVKLVQIDLDKVLLELLIILGSLDELQQQFFDIVGKFFKVLFDEIGCDLQIMLKILNKILIMVEQMVVCINNDIVFEMQVVMKDVCKILNVVECMLLDDVLLQLDICQIMQELSKVVVLICIFIDYL